MLFLPPACLLLKFFFALVLTAIQSDGRWNSSNFFVCLMLCQIDQYVNSMGMLHECKQKQEANWIEGAVLSNFPVLIHMGYWGACCIFSWRAGQEVRKGKEVFLPLLQGHNATALALESWKELGPFYTHVGRLV